MRFVGRLDGSWESSIGKSLAILPEVPGVGGSTVELPGDSAAKVISGDLVLDEIVRRGPPRVRGQLMVVVKSPSNEVTYGGDIEVDVVEK